jgi:nicotinamide-nucleotide amidase
VALALAGEPSNVTGAHVPAVEIVTIGNELLLGETVDGNAAWLARTLAAAGIRVARKSTVGDDVASIRDAVGAALQRSAVVLCTGGLGPTHDDLTRDAVAQLLERQLRMDKTVLEAMRRRFAMRGVAMSDTNRVQALVPDGAVIFPNPRGTAPGLAVEDETGHVVILLPGVPAEMRGLVTEHVLGFLGARLQSGAPILHRTLRMTGIAESTLAELLDDVVRAAGDVTVAFLPSVSGIDLRMTSWSAANPDAASAALDDMETRLRERAGQYAYGVDRQDLADVVGSRLRTDGLTLAVAESCTGGLVCKRLTDVPGSSAFLLAGFVTYANDAKTKFLGVAQETLDQHGAVSEETAREMLAGARAATAASAGIAVTGIAGPDGGTREKPVGTAWIGVSALERSHVQLFRFLGERDEIRERAAQAALLMLWNLLREQT